MTQWQQPQQPDPRRQQPPWPGYPPPPVQVNVQQYAGGRGYYPPGSKRRRTYTYQRGSNAFHWTMVVLTCGGWFLVWPFFRRKTRVTTRYR